MRYFFVGLMLFISLPASALAGRMDYGPYSDFLEEYTAPDTVVDGVKLTAVDYRRVVMNANDLSGPYARALAGFGKADPAALDTHGEKVAFWLNAYNLAAIRIIVENYPVDSIRSTKIDLFTLPWKKDAIEVGGMWYSLDRIEHGILLDELNEPMAHFGLVCASVSCPDLRLTPYTPEDVYAQLDEAARAFVNNTQKGVRIDREGGVVYLSKIFDWGEDDFAKLGGVKSVVAKYLDNPSDARYVRTGDYEIEYMDYDWGLNVAR